MRFIKEYANEKKRRIQQDNTLSTEEKEEAIDIISRAIRLHHYNLIPTDEAMREIANA